MAKRYAVVNTTDTDRVKAYLPSNYEAVSIYEQTLILGSDSAGWTLDDYVIPRLASGLLFAQEITDIVKWFEEV